MGELWSVGGKVLGISHGGHLPSFYINFNFLVDSLDDFIIKECGLTQIGKLEKYFQIVGRIRQTTSRVNPLFSKTLARPNHGVLRPLSPTQQYIDGLVFVQACEQLGESFDIGHLGVGDLHDYVTLSDTSF